MIDLIALLIMVNDGDLFLCLILCIKMIKAVVFSNDDAAMMIKQEQRVNEATCIFCSLKPNCFTLSNM